MKSISSPELHKYIGKIVRVEYVVEHVASPSVLIIDNKITGPVLLEAYDSKKQEITIKRQNGERTVISPVAVYEPG